MHITPGMLGVSPRKQAHLTQTSPFLKSLLFQRDCTCCSLQMVEFFNPGEVLKGFRYIHYPLLLIFENTQCSGKIEGAFSFLT